MNDKTREQKKYLSIFRAWDIAVYLCIFLMIAVLFFGFVVFPKQQEYSGFKILHQGKLVATYTFKDQTLTISNNSSVTLVQEDNLIKVYTDQTHYNFLEVNNKEFSVKVVSANCSVSKDCVYSPPLTTNNGAIVCAKHQLKIVPINYSGLTPPQTGGIAWKSHLLKN